MKRTHQFFSLTFVVLFAHLFLTASDQIPPVAWRIPIGQPPANPGGRKPELTNIDDGFWQGAPVGGIGAGTLSRSYRGNFERWHIKAGVHKYQSVPANQFAVFVQPEGEPAMAQVLSTGKPAGTALSAWNWTYPAGGGSTPRCTQSHGSRIARLNFPELWTGATFAIASHMLSEGMRDQAFHTARGVYNVVWKDRGYFFRTPEAYDARGMYRASMYMRPGAIWSMEPAPK